MPAQATNEFRVPVTVIVAVLHPKLQGSGSWNGAGIGAKNVLSVNQLAGLFTAVIIVAGAALTREQL